MVRGTKAALLVITALLGAEGAGWAESSVETAPPDISFEGWHVLRIEAHTGYMSLALPNANYNYLSGTLPVGSDVENGGSVSFGWRRVRRLSRIEFNYEPTYYSLARHSEWNALNHSLNFHASRKLAGRWNSSFAFAGGSSNLNGFLFKPPVLSRVTAAPGSFSSFADAVVAGRFNNEQIASVLTGAPVLESPERTVLYGRRVLHASFSSSLSYAPTARLTMRFGFSGARSQGLDDGQIFDSLSRAILQRTTTGTAAASLSYALSQQTDFGIDGSGSRSVSTLLDAYNTTMQAFLGRKIGMRWFVKGGGGISVVSPLRQAYRYYQIPQGPQPVAHGSFGYRTWRQSIMATVDRAADLYGTGAGHTFSMGGAWTWHRPASGWQYSASVRQQRMRGGRVQQLDGWLSTFAVLRALNRHSAMQVSYSYLNNSGTYLGAAREIAMHAVQFAIVWQEQGVR